MVAFETRKRDSRVHGSVSCVVFAALALGCASQPTGSRARSSEENLRPARGEGPMRTTPPPSTRPAASPSPQAPSNELMAVGLGADGWKRGSVGASVESPLLVRHEQLAWQPAPAVLPRGASVAVVEGDLSAAGKLFAVRLRMPDGYRIAPHWHHADEHVTVISGTLKLGHGESFDATAMSSLPKGGFAVLPARHHHFASAQGQTEIQIHGVGPWKIIYVNPKDDPSGAPGT